MSFHDTIEDLEPAIANLPAEKLGLIFRLLRKQGNPDIIDDLKKYPAFKWREYDVHDYSGPKRLASMNRTMTEYLDNYHFRNYTRRGPATPLPCPLVETITNPSGITFTSGIGNDLSKKFGGGAKFGGSSYISIADHSILNVTAEISIVGWAYIPSGSTAISIVKKNNQYNLYRSASNTLAWRIYSGGAWKTPTTMTYTPDTWFHFAATYKSTASGQKIYRDSVSQGTDAETGAIATSANALGIANDGAGAEILPNNTRLAWLSVLNKELAGADVTTHFGGLLNTQQWPEIVTYPFTTYPNYETDMSPGNFKP